MESNWNELLKDSHANTIFLTWEWISTWWKVYGDKYKLYIVTVKDSSGRLLAIAPLKIAERKFLQFCKISTLEFIGYGEEITPEHLNFVIRKGYENKIIRALLEYLLKNCSCDAYNFLPISSSISNISHIKSFFNDREAKYQLIESSICPVADLPNNWNQYLAGKSKNFRKKMKEYNRRVKRDLNVKLTKCNFVEELDQCYDQLIKLHHSRWNGLSNAFMSQRYIEFHRSILKIFLSKDWLRLYLLQDRNKPIAGLYCYFYNGQYFYYQSGRYLNYSKYRVGTVLLNKIIKEAINEGATHFDFLTGAESYKFRWANRVRKNYCFRYWRNKNQYLVSKLILKANKLLRIPFKIIRSKS